MNECGHPETDKSSLKRRSMSPLSPLWPFAFVVPVVVGAADESAFDQNVIALAERCRNAHLDAGWTKP